jgi:hypothetical protein
MIRVVMFDLGDTLLDAQGRPLPNVLPALQAIMSMRSASGKPLASCLVSDFTMTPGPPTPQKVKPLFDQYLARLAASGLRPLFEPVSRRVTLSTHAGAAKPARAVFEMALHRLRSNAALDECLLITEDAAHVAAVRHTLGMQALRFKGVGPAACDFDDWSAAPALVAHRIDPNNEANLTIAATAQLAARGVDVQTLAPAAPGQWRVSAQRWHPVQVPGHDDLGTLHVAIPVELALHRRPDGALQVELPAPDPEHLREAASFAASLAAHGQIGGGGTGRTTHTIETDAAGRRRLVRKRFSAV